MNVLHRWTALLIVLTMLLACLSGGVLAADTAFEDTGEMNYDVIFVVDGSWSMNKSDPEGIAEEAAKLFAHLCDPDNCRFGYVIYTDELERSQSLVELHDEQAVAAFEADLDELANTEHSTDSWSDIPLGLTEAKNILADACLGEERNPMIVLLSDGYATVDPNGERTEEDAEAELNETLIELVKDGVPVYTLGLSTNKNWTEDYSQVDEAYLENISSVTGGKYYRVEDIDTLQQYIDTIFADFNRIGEEECEVVWDEESGDYIATIPIKNSYVCMANVVVLGADVSNPRLYNPDGYQISLSDSSVSLKESKNYMLVKLMFPTIGDWKLHISGFEGEQPRVSLLSSYSLYAEQKLDCESAAIGDTITIQTAMFDGGTNPISDMALVSQLKASCEIANLNGAAGTELVDLTYDSATGWFTGSYQIAESGTYEFVSTVSSVNETFAKSSDAAQVVVAELVIPSTSATPIPSAEPLPENDTLATIAVWKYFSKICDLKDLTTAGIISCERIEGGDDLADISLDGTMVNLRGNKAGKTEITVYGNASDGTELILTGTLRVRNTLLLLIPIVLLVLVLLLLKKRSDNRRLRDPFLEFEITTQNGSGGEVAELRAPQGSKFTLYDLAKLYERDSEAYDWAETSSEELTGAKAVYAGELKKAVVAVGKDCRSITLDGTRYEYSPVQEQHILWTSNDGLVSIRFVYGGDGEELDDNQSGNDDYYDDTAYDYDESYGDDDY